MKPSFLILLFTILFLSCNKSNSTKDNSSKKKSDKDSSNTELSHYDFDSENPTIIQLPMDLKEISGITFTPDGKLFAQQDERAIIYQIDLTNGNIIKKFALGNPIVKEDFEDITYANNKFYLLRSNGDIYEFEEGENVSTVDYKIYRTDLKNSNDVEGICYDPETNSLLLALKGFAGEGMQGDKAVYSFSLDKMQLDEKPRFVCPLEEIKKYFNPSGIQRNPKTGTFFIIAANGNEIIEVNKEGKIIGRKNLPVSINVQPEGIAFSPNMDLLISNEGKAGKGYIVIYPYKQY